MTFKHTITDLPVKNEYPKLVRDKIPEIIYTNDGANVPTRFLLDDDEYLAFLLKKVSEEAEELSKALTDSSIKEEIADIYEVINTILALKHIQHEEIIDIQIEKREKRGGFSQRILMISKR